ncbi:hypothetical protein EDB83DRAFT_2361950 [Lactarius deliciosus]|nr:hypothetical protein EDB83DRAFT_2361950 [Lactarius deliciosus]
MPFPFTFNISMPGIMNPFSKSPDLPIPNETGDCGTPAAPVTINNLQEKRWLAVRRPHPSTLPPPVPLARKRGWQPSSPEPSPPAAVTMSTRGHLDVPSKYRDFTVTPEAREEEEEMEADLPPAKRRRTLAGTIVTGAVNAALIGTAVGLTVYRLWRDRGRVPELEPPPYEQGDWVPSEPEDASPPATVTTPTPRSKRTRTVPNTVRRGTNRHRKARSQTKLPVGSSRLSRHPSPHRPIKPEFDFESQADQGDELEDKMDWMGDRLARLIEDGKKALGKEVVVMSEAQEDEEDDGSGNWEEEAKLGTSSGQASRSGSIRRKDKSQALNFTSYASPFTTPPPSASPRRQQFSTLLSSHPTSALPIPGRSTHSTSVDTVQSYHSYRGDESQWQSPELRESMERARAAYLRDRQ